MIFIKYEGRHGNFIFQYLFARYLSFLTNQIIKDENLFYKYTNNKFIKFTVNNASDKTDYKENIIVDDTNVLSIVNNINLLINKNITIGGRNGYYQNSDIYLNNIDFIKSIINYKEKNLQIKPNSVVIHIRLDDFHRNGFDSEIISFSYYDNILKSNGKNKFEKVYVLHDSSTVMSSSYKKRIANKLNIDYSNYEIKYLNYFKEEYNAELISSNVENDFNFFKYFDNIILSASSFGFWGVCDINKKCNVYIPIHKQVNATCKTYKILEWLGHNVKTYDKIKFINFNEKIVEIGNVFPSCEGYYTETINEGSTLYLRHFSIDAGFFSHLSMGLYSIVRYYNITKNMPDKINLCLLLNLYKNECNKDISCETKSICKILFLDECICKTCNPNIIDNVGNWSGRYSLHCSKNLNYDLDISEHYFKYYTKPKNNLLAKSNFKHWSQFHPYNDDLINKLKPFVLSIFSPSDNILNIIKNIESKYNIDYDNTCVLFMRGGDKQKETKIPMYEEYTNKVKSEHHNNENLRYLIQSDETEFIEEMKKIFKNSFSFKEEIRTLPKKSRSQPDFGEWNNFVFSQYYFAITIIMSKCKYVYCNSGNCSLWIRLYRENNVGFNQWIHWENCDIWL